MGMFRLLTAREIECRVSQVKATGLSLLLYKDARADMNILDETVGPMNWQRRHTRENANCIVSIWDNDKKCWIEKEDTGTESNTEAEKGLASDSFKRACFNVGIGRELYTAPFIWIDKANCTIKKDEKEKYKCFDRFTVKDIGYNEHREINRLVIVNAKTHAVVYEYKAGATPEEEPEAREEEPILTQPTCQRCGSLITGIVLKDGTTMTAPEVIAKSKVAYKGIYCVECMKYLKAMREKAENNAL